METLVFETALGHVALAWAPALAEPLATGSSAGASASTGKSGRLLALSFGHPCERAALRALSCTLNRNVTDRKAMTSGRAAKAGSLSNPVAVSEDVHLGRVHLSSVDASSDELVDRLSAFARGEAESFDDLQIDTSHLTAFGRNVTAACRQIAWGETLTYGELAKRAGRPGAARAVGSLMARNRVPLIVPCHRVVSASGGLGGFSAPQGVAMKQRLLAMERQAALLSN